MTFEKMMRKLPKGQIATRIGWRGSGYLINGKKRPMYLQNGEWEPKQYCPPYEDIFATDWTVREDKTDKEQSK